MKSKKSLSIALILLMLNSSVSNAGGLQDMWNSNVTAGGAIDTKNRSGFSGGSATYRTPIKSIQLFNFTPPRVSAGCAGADIYMGSFSYINEAQIVSTLKAIMNNAQGLLFQAAIEFVSPMISGLMSKFNDLAQKLNGMQMNSCEIATSMMGGLVKSAGAAGNNIAKDMASSGAIGDWLTCKTGSTCKNNANTSTAEANSLNSGNPVWKGLKSAGSGKKIILPMFNVPAAPNDEQYINEVIMSFIGSFITTSTVSSKDVAAPDAYPLDGLIDFSDLKSGADNKAKYVCNNAECTDWTASSLSFTDADTYVKVMLSGNPSWLGSDKATITANFASMTALTIGTTVIPVHPDSIVGIISKASSTKKTLTAEQLRFLDSLSAPVVSILSKIHGAEYVQIKELEAHLQNAIAIDIQLKIANAVLSSIANMESTKNTDAGGNPVAGGAAKIELPENVLKRKAFLQSQQTALYAMQLDASKEVQEAWKLVESIIKARSMTGTGG